MKHDGGYQTRNQHGVVTNQRIETKYINEGNLYRLILRSKLPSAEKFESWVMDEVLPSIRKSGRFDTEGRDTDFMVKMVSAAMTEALKQITLFNGSIEQVEEPRKKHKHHKIHYAVANLSNELRKEVEYMILSEKYTYQNVTDFLSEQGIKISKSSIGRYAQRFRDEI